MAFAGRFRVIRTLTALGLAAAASLFATAGGAPGDPTNMEECVRMTQDPVEAQCGALFARPDQASQRAACLDSVAATVASVCERFFGAGKDFCAECTSACSANLAAGDGRRRECLSMCLAQPGCQ